jgi:toxin YoeB
MGQTAGKPEALKENLVGSWSRRIDEANRLIYRDDGNNQGQTR